MCLLSCRLWPQRQPELMTQCSSVIVNCITPVTCYVLRSSEGSSTSVSDVKAIGCSADWPALNVTLLKGLIVQALLHKERSLAPVLFINVEPFHVRLNFVSSTQFWSMHWTSIWQPALGFVCLSFLPSVQAIVVFEMKQYLLMFTDVDSATAIVLAVVLIKRVLRHFVQLLLH